MSGYLGLEGKRALVTGGTKGVGQATRMGRNGCGGPVGDAASRTGRHRL
jgi:hypothetical protein